VSAFEDAGQARTAAAIAGVDFDAQDDYCEACRAFHVDATHSEDVPVECGRIEIQGFNTVLECNRPPHDGHEHRTLIGQSWSSEVLLRRPRVCDARSMRGWLVRLWDAVRHGHTRHVCSRQRSFEHEHIGRHVCECGVRWG
jgi:hypothetical protein